MTTNALNPFEGTPVNGVGIEVPNASGGLNDALKIDPIEGHHGDTVVLVIETTVTKVRFDPMVKGEPDAGLRRVHVLSATNATIIDRALVAEALDLQRAKIEAAKDREKGVQRIPGARPDLDMHDDGLGGYDDDDDDDDDEPALLGEDPAPSGDDLPDDGGD